jgi:hypothetical protein
MGDHTTNITYAPAKKSPVNTFCEGQTWNSQYTQTIKTVSYKKSCISQQQNIGATEIAWQPCDTSSMKVFNEYETESRFIFEIDVKEEGNVEAINELKTTTAGIFNTVKISRRSNNFYDNPNSVIWLSTEYGVMVYKEDYNKLGVLEKTTELVSLE